MTQLRQLTCDKCGALFLVDDHRDTILWRRFCDQCWQPGRDEPTTVQLKIKTEYRWHINPRPSASIIVDLSSTI